MIDGITLQLHKEKEYKFQDCHQNILNEVELHLEDLHVKYDGIISKDKLIKYQEKKIEDSIIFEKNKNQIFTHNEGKPSNVKRY